ncbi:hypothetical protein Hanom_Chr06g00562281 [Helianthus anomalus]
MLRFQTNHLFDPHRLYPVPYHRYYNHPPDHQKFEKYYPLLYHLKTVLDRFHYVHTSYHLILGLYSDHGYMSYPDPGPNLKTQELWYLQQSWWVDFDLSRGIRSVLETGCLSSLDRGPCHPVMELDCRHHR